MKAASGELNLTVITIVAIAAVIGLFTTFLLPKITESIGNQWENVNTRGDDLNNAVDNSNP